MSITKRGWPVGTSSADRDVVRTIVARAVASVAGVDPAGAAQASGVQMHVALWPHLLPVRAAALVYSAVSGQPGGGAYSDMERDAARIAIDAGMTAADESWGAGLLATAGWKELRDLARAARSAGATWADLGAAGALVALWRSLGPAGAAQAAFDLVSDDSGERSLILWQCGTCHNMITEYPPGAGHAQQGHAAGCLRERLEPFGNPHGGSWLPEPRSAPPEESAARSPA